MLLITLLTIYFTITFFIGICYVCEITIMKSTYKDIKLWQLIISIIFFSGSILGILIGHIINKISNKFYKTSFYKIMDKEIFRG